MPDTTKLTAHFNPNYRAKSAKQVTLEVPSDATCRWRQEHGCLIVEERGGNVIAAFNGVSWFSRESAAAEETWVRLPESEQQ